MKKKREKEKKKTEEVTDEPCDHNFSVFLPLPGSDHIKNAHKDLSLNQHIIKAVSNSKNRKVLSGSLGSDNEIKKTQSANFHLIRNSKMVKRKWLVLFSFPFFFLQVSTATSPAGRWRTTEGISGSQSSGRIIFSASSVGTLWRKDPESKSAQVREHLLAQQPFTCPKNTPIQRDVLTRSPRNKQPHVTNLGK